MHESEHYVSANESIATALQ